VTATSGALDGRVAIVTGASKGIGKAIARRLAREGARVMLSARGEEGLNTAVQELDGMQVAATAADVGNGRQARGLVEETVRKWGRIDLLVNNAGVGVFGPFMEMEESDLDMMINTNLRGVFLMTKAALPHMIRGGGGHVVNIASLAGKNGVKGGAVYSATKWALRGFGASLLLEVREHDIRVTTVFPGSVDTSFSSGGKRGRNITQPEDVADAVLFAVTAPARSMFSEIDVRPTKP
jgi:NADP-dependent 3-hydroxy acid dehydrogenase YdfG